MNTERVMERVRRLLAIANDPAASDNEQRIALEQAQRLMDKHAIEEWQLEENHDDVEIIKRRIRLETNPCNRYMAQLANIVARGNRCRASYGCRRAGNENSRPKFEQLIDPRQPLSEFITGLTGITDQMLQGMPTAGAAMLRFHQWLDRTWPAGEPLTIIAHNAEFDVSFLDAAERIYDPTASGFDCRWLCTKEMSWELNPQKRHHRVTDLIADYHIGDTEEHRALADAIQEQMIYRALCHEATMRGKWIGQ